MHTPPVGLRAVTIIGIAISALCVDSCSKRTEHDVFDLPCGPGRLVLHEDHLTTFETAYVTFELRSIAGKNDRLVDKLKPRARVYLAPTAAEHLHYFRNDRAEGPWPIFVSPSQFSLAEYEQIRQTLQSNLAHIDEAVNRPREPLEHFREDRKPLISSIRYLDYDGLRHTYGGPDKGPTLRLNRTAVCGWGKHGVVAEQVELLSVLRTKIAYCLLPTVPD